MKGERARMGNGVEPTLKSRAAEEGREAEEEEGREKGKREREREREPEAVGSLQQHGQSGEHRR
jgi:hypothetical protein